MAGWTGYSTRTEDAQFTCQRCRFQGSARVTVVGRGHATLLFDKPEKALTDARVDARDKVQRDIKRARCPKCGERNPGQTLWFWLPWGVGFPAAVVLGFCYLPMLLFPLVLSI